MGFVSRLLTLLSLTIATTLTLYVLVVWPRISRWGATNAEVEKPLAGDELIAAPIIASTKAVTIAASVDQVWSWLVQLGVDRGGMYSYLWVENGLLQLHVTNTNEIRPEWQQLQVGDFLRFTPKSYPLNPGPGLYVTALERHRALVGCFGLEDQAPDCGKSATWQFVLEPQGENATRLLLRSRVAGQPSLMGTLAAKIGYAFQFYMERKMLLEIKARAEMIRSQ